MRVDVQRESMDQALKNRLWSALCVLVFEVSEHDYRFDYNEDPDAIATRLWLHFFNNPIDTKPRNGLPGLQSAIREWFMGAKWHQVYDFVEAVAEELRGKHRTAFTDLVNAFLAQDQAAYRFVGAQLADITNEQEIAAIEGGITDASPITGVRKHLEAALSFLTDRAKPDYRNSVKESILAVESMCQVLTGDSSATLGKALKQLADKGIALHPAIKEAWLKLYGYSSDEGGIRHAMIEEPAVSRADAKYMLVTCSAFVSFLVEQAASAKIELKAPAA